MPRLSIIITCFNLGEYLDDALINIINYPNNDILEIILINDGSTNPNTISIVNRLENLYPNILVINQKNQGLAKARNNGIKIAKGEYIIPLDADNKLRQSFIEESIKLLDNYKEVEVVHGNAQFFGTRQGLWKVDKAVVEEMVLNNKIDACACFRKKTWEALGGYDERMPLMGFEDWDLWLRMFAKGMKFKYVDKIFFDYRVRDNSMLSLAWSKREQLVKYIFNKPELKNLRILRNILIENQNLRKEPSMGTLLKIIKTKFLRKIKF